MPPRRRGGAGARGVSDDEGEGPGSGDGEGDDGGGGGAVRRFFLRRIRSGERTVVAIQRHRAGLWDAVFSCTAICVNEDFYLLVLPSWIWLGGADPRLGYFVTWVVCYGQLLGNMSKDLFSLPRPRAPPVWRSSAAASLDTTACEDFGFPSTHAMNALSNSAVALGSAVAAGSDWFVPGAAAACAYTASISFGRLYQGFHTPIDLAGGVALGALLVLGFFVCGERYYAWAQADPLGCAKLACLLAIALALWPQPLRPTPSFNQTTGMVGLIIGQAAGMHWSAARGNICAPAQLPSAGGGGGSVETGTWECVGLRLLVGFVVVGLTRLLVKACAKFLFGLALGTEVAAAKEDRVLRDVLVKVTTYSAIGFSVCGASLDAFAALGILNAEGCGFVN